MLDLTKPNCADSGAQDRLESLAAQWRNLFPLDEDFALAQQSYDEDFLIRMAYNSNAIEGSTLTLNETEIIYEGEFVAGKPGREQVAARGIFEGSAYLDDALAAKELLNQDLILNLHERCALDLQPRSRGIYRNAPAIIRASRTVPVAAHKIRTAMDDLLFEYQAMLDDQQPLLAIAWFHAAFEQIHPFADGNGRTGRLLMNYQLGLAGYPPITIKVNDALAYKTSLETWQADGDPRPFLDLFFATLKEELTKRIDFLSEETPVD